MGLITAIILVICGALAAASFIVAKKPNAKELLDKLAPYQGWIGLVVCLWGAWTIISCFLSLGLLTSWPLWWVTIMAVGVVELRGWGSCSDSGSSPSTPLATASKPWPAASICAGS